MCRKQNLTYSQVGEVFKQSPAVVVNTVVLQNKQLAYVPGSDVTGNLHCSAGVIFIVDFDYLQKKHQINNHLAGQDALYLQGV